MVIAGRGQPVTVAVSRPPFPNRALWLQDRLTERRWDKHDLQRAHGPHHKTTQKILNGLPIQDGVLRKVIIGLQSKMTNNGRALPAVEYSRIPKD